MGGRRPFALAGAFTLRLGRRNLYPDAFTLLLGRRYNRAKKQGERTDITSGKSCQKSTTAERLAKEHGVTEKTVRNAGKFAESVEKAKAGELLELAAKKRLAPNTLRSLPENRNLFGAAQR